MKVCISCGKPINDGDKFCTYCGAKQDIVDEKSNSLFTKYAGYLDNEALFKVAWAKEKGLIKSDSPNEAETIYQLLALKGHLESAFRYAMVLLAKTPPQRSTAEKWLKIAADKGHVQSINYLETIFYAQTPKTAEQPQQPVITVNEVPAPIEHVENKVTGQLLSGAEIYGKLEPSVVEVLATTDGKEGSRASGFIVSSNGFVITNAHAVLHDCGDLHKIIHVKTGEHEYEAMPVAVGQPASAGSNAVDIALLFVKELAESTPAVLGNSDSCENGQKIYLLGNSLGEGICITSGIISDKHRTVDGLSYPYIMTDAAANHGNSGGPLVNERGETIGVLVSGIEAAEGMNYAIPANVVKSFLAYVIQKTDLTKCTALAPLRYENNTLAFHWDNLFAGIHIIVDVIALIMNLL